MTDRFITARFMTAADAARAARTLAKLERHGIGRVLARRKQRLALTGGLAIETHCLRRGRAARVRALNDIDFVAESFADVPESLAADFLFRHIHPAEVQGRNMLQFVDEQNAIRVDVFRAIGGTMSRAHDGLVSIEDLAARAARLALDLAAGVPTPSKYAADFLRLAELVDSAKAETAWREHRKAAQPESWDDAVKLLRRLIPASGDLLITPEYSKDTQAACSRCAPAGAFRFADAEAVLAVLGYC